MIKSCILLILFFSFSISADILYEFENLEDEKRFYNLIKEVRCPKCTSGSLASSNAPVSEDLKQKIIELIKKGKTDKEIKAFLTIDLSLFYRYLMSYFDQIRLRFHIPSSVRNLSILMQLLVQ